MTKVLLLALFAGTYVFAGPNALVGVWKADLENSKIPGPPGAPKPTNYLVIVEEKMATFDQRTKEQAPQMVETTGVWGERGQQRSTLTVFNNSKAIVRSYQGVPTRLTAGWQADEFIVDGEMAGRDSTFKRVYKLSPDGKTLTVSIQSTTDGKASQSKLVLLKQPDDAGDPLRKPEELAQTRFKNVKVAALKSLPESEFLNRMHYFAWALNRNCEFCHVPRKFDSDEKKEKETARKMVEMVAAIDHDHFEGHPAVDCFTCHEGHAHPLRHNQFPEEAAAEKAAIEKAAAKAAAERRALQNTPPTAPRPQ
ncbi:MAG: photosynthetic reaction center cytochrome c subunit family protein [Bryobacteraceae bacterium]